MCVLAQVKYTAGMWMHDGAVCKKLSDQLSTQLKHYSYHDNSMNNRQFSRVTQQSIDFSSIPQAFAAADVR